MENRVNARPFATNSANENALVSIKSANAGIQPTPKKLPFKDTTNKDLLKSAVKKKNDLTPPVGQTSPSCSNSKSTESENLPFDDFDDTPFVFPPDNKCFCCGDKRIHDFELVGEDFERAKAVLEEVLSYDPHIKRSSAKQWSPISTPVPEPAFIFDHEVEVASGPVPIPSLEQEDISFVESDLSDTDSILDVPEYDFNFSSQIDSSIITDCPSSTPVLNTLRL